MNFIKIRAVDFCKSITDGTHDSPKRTKTGKPLVTSKHLSRYGIDFDSTYLISESDYKKVIARSRVDKWDVLYSMIGTIGNIYIETSNNTEYACKNVGIFKMGGAEYKSKWLYYYLQTRAAQEYILGVSRGTTQGYVPLGALRELQIPITDSYTMNRITSVLWEIDEKIKNNRAINHNLQQQASELFDAWFISFVRSDGKMPADWHKGTLGDIAAITSGKRPPMKQAVASVDATIPLVGAASIMGFTNAILYNEPILVTGRVGTHGVVQRFQSPCWISDNTLVIKSDFYEYTFQVLQRVDYVNMNRGSTQPLITQTDLKNVSIVIPTEEVLLEYEKIAGSLMAMYESNRKENERLSTLRDTLLPKLMSGEIDVSQVEV